jgi:DNA replication protein DnaD
MEIAVKANKRSWNYVLGILKRCKEKNVRPSLNRLENSNGNNHAGNRKGAKRTQPKSKGTADEYNQADLDAAERINARVR